MAKDVLLIGEAHVKPSRMKVRQCILERMSKGKFKVLVEGLLP